ncbi:MAG: serine O-acetyltransferase, partial [Rhodocyclaceae bacterium]|nr:serine O-acetyltransferase [Rhodocyclaceae bacterium]
RIIDRERDDAREQKAEAMGFSAYGVTRDMDDPMAKAIHGLLDHAVETDRRLALMIQRLEAAGVPVNGDGESVDDFDAERLGKMVD